MSDRQTVQPDRLLEGFGLLIAYLCPGFLTLWAMHVAVPSLSMPWEDGAGGFVFLIVAAVGVGMVLSAVRQLVVNDLLFRHVRALSVPGENDFEEDVRRDAGTEAAYRDIRASFFPYFQFYSHMFVATPLVYLAWLSTAPPLPTAISFGAGAIGVSFVLLMNARHSLSRFRARRNLLLRRPTRVAS